MKRRNILIIALFLVLAFCIVLASNSFFAPKKDKLVLGSWTQHYEDRGTQVKFNGKIYINFGIVDSYSSLTFLENGTLQYNDYVPGSFAVEGEKVNLHRGYGGIDSYRIVELTKERMVLTKDEIYENAIICFTFYRP